MAASGQGNVPAARCRARVPGSLGLATISASVGLAVAVTVLGPSVAEPPLQGASGEPPYSLHVNPDAWLVVALVLAALVTGAAGLGLVLWATARGFRPRPGALVIAGAIAAGVLVLLPPIGSADFLGYAAYGRMVTRGLSPYSTTPQQLAALGDAIGRAVEDPWTRVASVYGPVATAEQAAASLIGGASPRRTVFCLSVGGAAAFVLTGLLLQRAAGPDRVRRVRAAVLWSANPLLLVELVAGAHVDAFGIVFAVAAVVTLRRSRMVSGALLGLAAAVKIPLALVGAGLLWAARGSRRRVVAVIVGAAVVSAVVYGVAGPHIFVEINRISGYVSLATPWHIAALRLDPTLGGGASRGLIRALSYLCGLGAAALFLYGLPPAPSRRGEAGRVALAFALAWLVTAPYTLPWYDSVAWAFLPFVRRSPFDALLIGRTTMLAVAYVPGRFHLPPEMTWWMVHVLRSEVAPVVMALLALGFFAAAARARARVSTGGRVPVP